MVVAVQRASAESVPPAHSGVAVFLSFPARRYHATPWGHHVNEGLIEWPPSPWRLLRSFLATGYTKLGWTAGGPPLLARSLLEKLASVLPHYRLPRAVGTHSRHYMPAARFKNGREETTMVLDTWAQIDDGAIGVHWNADLTPAERELFAHLVGELGYLGRSESWVEGWSANTVNAEEFDVKPGEASDCPGPGWEQVPLLAAVPAEEYLSWRVQAVRVAIEKLPEVNSKGKPLTKGQKAKQLEETEASYPMDLIACLQVETAWLKSLGWNQPPGSRKVFYWRRADSLETTPPRLRATSIEPAPVEFMLLSMATASGNLHALPSIVRTLPQGELLHQALLAHCPKGQDPPPVLSGRNAEGSPLRDEQGHQHAHLVHLDLDGDGHLDHALVWAPMGLDAQAQRTVRAVRRTFAKGTDPLRLAIAAAGAHEDLLGLPSPWGDELNHVLGGVSGSVRWRSCTPFVPPRFLKPRGRNTLEGQVRAELAVRGFPEPLVIRTLDPHTDTDLARKSRHFIRRRARRGAPPPPSDCGFMLDLEFAEPVTGPLLLGYGSHFGLGLFVVG